MTRAQRSAHRLAWGVVGLLVTSVALWALTQRASVPIDTSGAHVAAPSAGSGGVGGGVHP